MTTDPNGWFLASNALDHRETTAALTSAIPPWLTPDIATTPEGLELAVSEIVTGLARAGFALVRIHPDNGLARDPGAQAFLTREQD